MGGKSRKSGSVSKKLIERIKGGKTAKNAEKKATEQSKKGLDFGE